MSDAITSEELRIIVTEHGPYRVVGAVGAITVFSPLLITRIPQAGSA